MVLVRHRAQGPGGKAAWRQEELRTRDLVILRSRYVGSIRDERFSPEIAEGCSSIRVVLDGPLVARVGERSVDLRDSELYASVTHGTARARMLTTTSDVLFLGWRHGTSVGRAIADDDSLRPSASTTTCLHRLARALDAASAGSIAAAAADALAALRAEGLPFEASAAAALADAPTHAASEQDVANAIEHSLASLAAQPTSLDLSRALGVGEHHALRRTTEHFRRFYFSVRGWREYLRRRRVDLGAFFMGRPDARTEDVARLLGFRSPTSFCHAFQAAGLPSPRAVQGLLLAS